jgi:hypothetical protein
MSSIPGMTKPVLLPLSLPMYTTAADVNGLASSGGKKHASALKLADGSSFLLLADGASRLSLNS